MTDAWQRPRAVPGLVFEDLEGSDEVVVVDPERDVAIAVNQTAAAVLELCDGSRTLEEVAKVLAEIWQVDVAAVEGDVGQILAGFNDFGLVIWE